MLIAELAKYNQSTPLVNYSPFVYSTIFGEHTTATYWTSTFGATGDSSTAEKNVTFVLENPNTKYTKANSIVECEAAQQSFYWDNANQELYLHITHTSFPDYLNFAVGIVSGFSDETVTYIDGVEYLPLLRSVPGVAQKADIVNYDRLAFISGSIVFDNTDGFFDQFIDQPIYGNDISIAYLPKIEGQMDYVGSDLTPLVNFYVEDYSFSLSSFTIKAQDKRKAQNSRIIKSRTPRGQEVPLIYGTPNRVKALVNEAEGTTGATVAYRVAETLTAIGTVQVNIDDTWTTRTTNSVNLADGTFTLSAANGRVGGVNGGAPLPCRVVSPTGIAISNVADIIKDLNYRITGIPYSESFYDTEEWEAESASLTTGAIVYDKDMELYEAIRMVQAGSNVGFRYEIRADGQRSIRIDDWARTPQQFALWTTENGSLVSTEEGNSIYFSIPRPDLSVIDLKDNKTLNISTDTASFAASVTVAYNKDYNEGSYSRVKNSDFEADAFNKYRQNPSIEIQSILTGQAHAEARALWSATRLSEVRPILTCELHGTDFYDVRIYDTVVIDLGTTQRTYFGKWKAQIIGIDPKFDGLTNKVTMVLTERVV